MSEAELDYLYEHIGDAVHKALAEWHVFEGSPAQNTSRIEFSTDVVESVAYRINRQA